MKVVTRQTDRGPRHFWWCEGCDHIHAVDDSWHPRGLPDSATFTPSVLVTYNGSDAGNGGPPARCHVFVKDGHIQFLTDCTHKLAGQTVAMVDMPRGWFDEETQS